MWLEVQFVLDGLMTGSIYALVALGFTVIWSSMRLVSLAHPDLLAVGAGTGYVVASSGFLVAAGAAVGVASVVGVATYFLAIRPLLQTSLLSVMVSTLGVGIIIQAVIAQINGDDARGMPSLLGTGGWIVGPFYFRQSAVIVAAIALVMLAVALYVANRTRIGLAFRATAWSADIGAMHGINVSFVRLGSVVMASAYAGLAGLLIGILFGQFSPYMGLTVALPAMIAMLVGGAGNLYGAMVGGLTLGVIQSVASAHIAGSLSNLVAFAVLVGLMVVRPQGLLSER